MIFTIGSDPPSIHLSVLWVWKMPGHAWKHRWSIIFLIEMAITWRGYMYPIDTPISQHIHFALAAMGTHSPPIYHHYWGTRVPLLVGHIHHCSLEDHPMDRQWWIRLVILMGDLQDPKLEVRTLYKAYFLGLISGNIPRKYGQTYGTVPPF